METTYRPGSILSTNTKTGCSINLPIAGHCTPTKNCSKTCYAKCGHTAMPSNKKKQVWVSEYLKGKDLTELVNECKARTAVRLSGTGDLLEEHTKNIIRLAKACPDTMFWGMTRKLNIAKKLKGYKNIKVMVSVDSSSPKKTWDYKGALCYGPRLNTDTVPKDKRIITIFPYHFAGKVVDKTNSPLDSRDCPAIRHTVSGCLNCNRCWKW